MLTKQEFIFSNQRSCRAARHLAFWLIFSLHIFLFRYYLKDLKYLFIASTYVIRLENLLLFLPVSVFYAYFSLYFLLPHYILKGKYLRLLLIICLLSILLLLGSYLLSTVFNIRLAWDQPLERESIVRQIDFTVSNGLVYPLTVSAFAIGIKMAKNFYLKQKENEQLLQQKVKKEIQLLKAEIHPDFLFHSLDAVYNDMLGGFEKSPAMLLKLSDLLSYILYESGEEMVPLEKELAMAEDYLALEKISYGEALQISIDNKISSTGKLIAPLLILPILECVLEQHFIHKYQHLVLTVRMHLKETDFYFTLTARLKEGLVAGEIDKNERLLKVHKRLIALYPNRHIFKISAEGSQWIITLIILLNEEVSIADLETAHLKEVV